MPELQPAEVLAAYPPHADTLPTLLASRVAVAPDKTVLEFEGRVWTYGALDEVSTQLAQAAAQRDVNKGDRIALVSVNTDLSVIIFLAAAKLGALFVPLNPAATDADLQYLLGHSRASVVVCQPDEVERIRSICDALDNGSIRVIDLNELGLGAPDAETLGASIARLVPSTERVELAEIGPDDPLVVIYTSGTTGFPKGVVHTQRNYVLAGESFVARMHLQPEDRLLALLPFFHINALFYSLGGTLAAGATLITARRFSASQFWRFAAETRATEFNFLAAVGSILMKRPRSEFDPTHRIRKMYGAPITAEMLRVFTEEFHVPHVIEGYGMTEIPGASCNPFYGPHKLASIGVPAVHPRFPGNFSALRVEDDNGQELPVGEVGELLVRTPIVFKEYLNDPEQTAAAFRNGWFLTGDLVKRDADDYFFFVARKKDIIRRRGENISGAELDRVVSSHPQVLEAAAIGVPSELGEEEIMVVVVRKPDAPALQAADIVSWCRSHLAPMKVPRYVSFAESLPHTPSHRVAKHRLKGQPELLAAAVDMERPLA
ncbi:MAG TPA: AMP-binding protein [Steroidobacteraceae bacterium]|jgi:crotonobetaine/carnitine-CoA ligase|nr:AMP-binding protein [Steroidobacteraceae bacterium]